MLHDTGLQSHGLSLQHNSRDPSRVVGPRQWPWYRGRLGRLSPLRQGAQTARPSPSNAATTSGVTALRASQGWQQMIHFAHAGGDQRVDYCNSIHRRIAQCAERELQCGAVCHICDTTAAGIRKLGSDRQAGRASAAYFGVLFKTQYVLTAFRSSPYSLA